MCTTAACPSSAVISCWCPLVEEKRSFGNNPDGPSRSNSNFALPVCSLSSLEDSCSRPGRRALQRCSQPLPRYPGPSTLGALPVCVWGLRSDWNSWTWKSTRDLGQEKAAPRSPIPKPRGGRGGPRHPDCPFWVSGTLSLGRELAGFPRTGTK